MTLAIEELVRRAQTLGFSYWNAGPSGPGALSDLCGAIEAFTEAHQLLEAGHPARGQIAAQLGWLMMDRHTVHGTSAADREAGIGILDEAISSPGLPPTQTMLARLALGQLLLSRAMAGTNPGAAHPGLRGSDSMPDAAKAIQCFREVLASPVVSPEVTLLVQTLLGIAEAILPIFSDELTSFDIGKYMSAVAAAQHMGQGTGQFATMKTAGVPAPLTFPIDFSPVDQLDGPEADPQEAAPEMPPPQILAPQLPAPQTPAPAPVARVAAVLVAPAGPNTARLAARSRLAGLSAQPERTVWEQVLALLQADPEVARADLDSFVGAAVNAVDAAEGDDPVEAGLDRLLAACGLCLREQRDGNGWGAEDDGESSLAAEQLLAARELIPPDHPAAAVVEALGGVLD
ncbi:hypothetical protein [Kribbella sp. NPDC051718]|uniref:hypothetical protein n=1 Tax=Kribbella sp. NPDC051718 TaxID=3155168 RepID=UPI00341FE458